MRTGIRSTDDIEDLPNDFSNAVNRAYEASCPVVRVLNKKTSWWTNELSEHRNLTRRLFIRAEVNDD